MDAKPQAAGLLLRCLSVDGLPPVADLTADVSPPNPLFFPPRPLPLRPPPALGGRARLPAFAVLAALRSIGDRLAGGRLGSRRRGVAAHLAEQVIRGLALALRLRLGQ